MRLNVGCGEHYATGWTNLDQAVSEQVRPDLVGSLTDLPAAVTGVSAVYLGHVLEHLDHPTAQRALPGLWQRCLPGAQVALVGPDTDRARALHRRGEISDATLHGALYGACRWPGDEHRWECTEARLVDLAHATGLTARPVPLDDPALAPFPVVSRAPWQCAVVGTVPGPGRP